MRHIDVKQDLEELTELIEVAEEDVFILHPGEFVLGDTLERVALPNDLVTSRSPRRPVGGRSENCNRVTRCSMSTGSRAPCVLPRP